MSSLKHFAINVQIELFATEPEGGQLHTHSADKSVYFAPKSVLMNWYRVTTVYYSVSGYYKQLLKYVDSQQTDNTQCKWAGGIPCLRHHLVSFTFYTKYKIQAI